MIKEFNEYLEEIKESGQGSGFVRYHKAKAITEELYNRAMETLIMVTVGNDKEKLEEQGVELEGKFDEDLKKRNQEVMLKVREILDMRFGYEEIFQNMNKDRMFEDDKMSKDELTFRQYNGGLIDFNENKGIYSDKSVQQALAQGEVDKAVFMPMYHRSATMEFRILEGGIIKMTDLSTDDTGNTIIIMPVKDYDVIDVLLVDTAFTEYEMEDEEFEGIRKSDAVRMAWKTIQNGVKGEAELNDSWNRYLRDSGQVTDEDEDTEDVSDELDELDKIVLDTFEGNSEEDDGDENTAETRYRFVRDESKIEDNNEVAELMDEAFKKYREMHDFMRQRKVEENSVKMAKVVNTIAAPKQ